MLQYINLYLYVNVSIYYRYINKFVPNCIRIQIYHSHLVKLYIKIYILNLFLIKIILIFIYVKYTKNTRNVSDRIRVSNQAHEINNGWIQVSPSSIRNTKIYETKQLPPLFMDVFFFIKLFYSHSICSIPIFRYR